MRKLKVSQSPINVTQESMVDLKSNIFNRKKVTAFYF